MKRIIVDAGFAVALAAVVAAAPPAGAVTIVLPRAGQVGVGVQGQFGTLLQSGNLGNEFGSGAGLAIKLVYRMRYERAIGLSFESSQLQTRVPRFDQTAFLASPDSLTRSTLNVTSAGFDIYQYFNTRTRTPRYLDAGIGLAEVNSELQDGEITYPPDGSDGLYLSAGAGFERFVYRSWAVDASAKYRAIFFDGEVNHTVQASLGMIFYAAY
ncbi:MAG TPA: outer membrane beta-barrel protein [Candidatus Acidoferrales bacterium]|nr:outer membrane beta-barrel protein [Candidatus Acidoferrales bacterium]